ncbi:hypothetical protein LIA77_01721 [Sarocladium implicatum]|nr:hypothetical protein LIA77_01721 [Sarocladium implicatum]
MADSKQPLTSPLTSPLPPPAPGLTPSLTFASSSSPSPSINPNDPAVLQIRQSIASSASRNTELLLQLTQTASAPGLFSNNETSSRHAQKRLRQQQEEVEIAKVGSKLQFEKHKRFSDSGTRKLYYTLRRKREEFEKRAVQEEKRYVEALERRHKAEAVLLEVQEEVMKLEIEGKTIRTQLDRHGAAHKAIDQLYASIFDGPTPGFPHEDVQEERHIGAKAQHRQAMERTQATVQGRKAAEAIAGVLDRAVREAKIAMDESQGRSLISVIGFRLKRCTAYVDLAITLNNKVLVGLSQPIWPVLLQAKQGLERILEVVRALPTHRSDLYGTAQATASRYYTLLTKEARTAQTHLVHTVKAASEAQRHRVRGTARILEDERQNLQQVRQAAFEKTVGFGEAAPAYTECCDRAAGYEGEVDVMCARITDVVVDDLPDVCAAEEEEEDMPPGYEQVEERTVSSEEQMSRHENGSARRVISRRPVPVST